jgi:hypothetical protein
MTKRLGNRPSYETGRVVAFSEGHRARRRRRTRTLYVCQRTKGRHLYATVHHFVCPILALHVAGVVPKLSELRVFHEGMAIGLSELEFPAPSPDFMRWSYERYVAAPLKVGNHVEVKTESGWVQGRIVDGQFDELVCGRP